MGVPRCDLNYDETVGYKNEAIQPVYLVAYGGQREKTGKLGKRTRWLRLALRAECWCVWRQGANTQASGLYTHPYIP